MSSALESLCGPDRPLRVEPADARELARLVRSAETGLADAANPTVSLEGRFYCAYGAAHALCLAALRYRGFRPRHRYIVFQALPHTLGLGPEVWRVLARAHELRNVGEYEGLLEVNERMVTDLLAAARAVAAALAGLPPLR